MQKTKYFLGHYKFELFLFALCLNLFGSLIFSNSIFNSFVFPISLLLSIVTGINLISNVKIKILFTILFIGSACTFGYQMLENENLDVDYIRFALYFCFYVVITYEIIKQILKAKTVNKNVIIGVISGYICLGLVGFFLFTAIELANPGSYTGIIASSELIEDKIDGLLYYSFITLMTIGYGEIIPTTEIAQKGAILIGLIGQFYIVIVTAFVVGKYINNKSVI